LNGKTLKTLAIFLIVFFFLIVGRIGISLAANTLFSDASPVEPAVPIPQLLT